MSMNGGGEEKMKAQGSYDVSRLVSASPALRPHIIPAHLSKSGRATIDFADAAEVRALNAALLKADYNVQPAAEQQKGYFPPEQTLVLRPVDHHRKELLENAIMAESPPRKLSSVADKFRGSRTAVGNIQGSLLLMYANYGSAVEAQRAKVVRIHFVV